MIQPMIKTATYKIPSLRADVICEVDEKSQLALFRGIPYATVEKRWTHSEEKTSLESPFDATSFGPRCVQGQGEVLVSGGVNDPTPGDDEFNCLNLNIAVPQEALRSTAGEHGLPVMVWIHGGAFNYGANSVARYRPAEFCSIATSSGTPVVLVQIGYRLGPLGFAASADLATDADTTDRRSDFSDNVTRSGSYGFIDQRNAFKWVKHHIRDFGGNPDNVTAFGVSAGSASVHFHILTGTPLFDRAIMMSGTAGTLGPLPMEVYERSWAQMCQKLKLAACDPKERLMRLRSLPPDEIIAAYSKAAMGPCGDGELLPSSWSFQDTRDTRCKTVILGDTRVEAIILDGLFKTIPQPTFLSLVQSIFSTDEAIGFANAFGFSVSGELQQDDYIRCMRHFFSVMMFQYPNIRISSIQNSPYRAYLYHFEEPSPYPGPTNGVPYHGQCALYLHNNDIDTYPASGKHVAAEMARIWSAFAHAREPWEPYSEHRRFMRFGPGSSSTLRNFEDDGTRTYTYLGWLDKHWDQTKLLAQQILQGEGRRN